MSFPQKIVICLDMVVAGIRPACLHRDSPAYRREIQSSGLYSL
jgi:hypothetical protein